MAAGRGTAPLEILHDGTVAGTLVPGQTLRLPARPGVHRLEARSAAGSHGVTYSVRGTQPAVARAGEKKY